MNRHNPRLFLGSLPPDVSVDDVRALLADHHALEVRVPTNRDGAPYGLAFVGFQSIEEVDRAADALDGVIFGGRRIRAARANDSAGGAPPARPRLTHRLGDARLSRKW